MLEDVAELVRRERAVSVGFRRGIHSKLKCKPMMQTDLK